MQIDKVSFQLAGCFLGVAGFQMPKEAAARFHQARLGCSAGNPAKKTQEYIRERVDQYGEDFVARCEGQQAIEFRNVANSLLVTPEPRHFLRMVDVFSNRFDVGVGCPLACQPHDARLDQKTSLRQIVQGDSTEMDKVLHDPCHAFRVTCANERSSFAAIIPQDQDPGDL